MMTGERWVEVRPHDPRWLVLYRVESAAIRSALGEYVVAVEHFGSTAVPALVAKPIVDILVGIGAGTSPDRAIKGLAGLGYEYLGEDGRRPGRHFWQKRSDDSFNVSVVPYGGRLWSSNLAVRDFLCTHDDWADRYGRVKEQGSEACGKSLQAYQDHKRRFVDELRVAALAWASETHPYSR